MAGCLGPWAFTLTPGPAPAAASGCGLCPFGHGLRRQGAQYVAVTPVRLEIPLAPGRGLQPLAQLANEDAYDLEIGLICPAIESVEEGRLVERPPLVQREEFESRVLLRRQRPAELGDLIRDDIRALFGRVADLVERMDQPAADGEPGRDRAPGRRPAAGAPELCRRAARRGGQRRSLDQSPEPGRLRDIRPFPCRCPALALRPPARSGGQQTQSPR